MSQARTAFESRRNVLKQMKRVRDMLSVARESGLAREALYRALSETENPSFSTLLRAMHALGLQLHVSPLKSS